MKASKANNSIDCSDMSSNESKEGISESIKCTDDQNSLSDCTDTKSAKSEWPSNQVEDIENKTDILPETALSSYGAQANGQDECVAMEVEVERFANADRSESDSSSNSKVENMEVEEYEKRESLKRQRETSLTDESNKVLPIFVTLDEPLLNVISRIFAIDIKDFEEESQAMRVESNSSLVATNHSNLIQTILMDVIYKLMNCSDYDSAFKIYNEMKSIENGKIAKELVCNSLIKANDKSILVFRYLLECYVRLSHEESSLSNRDQCRPTLATVRHQIIQFSCLVLTNSLAKPSLSPNSNSILAQFLLHRCLPKGFLSDLVCHTYQNDSNNNTDAFNKIFTPVLQYLWQEMQKECSLSRPNDSYRHPLQALNELCAITEGKSHRPVCQLVSCGAI